MHNAADYPDRTQAGVYMGHLERLTKYQKYFQKQKAPIQYNKLYIYILTHTVFIIYYIYNYDIYINDMGKYNSYIHIANDSIFTKVIPKR